MKNNSRIPDFSKATNGLLPAIVQDDATGKVLMLGYMNKESLEITKKLKKLTFFSRSRNKLWTKGDESKNFLFLKDILVDCDNDTILIKASPAGPVCHTGSDTCFNESNSSNDFLVTLENTIADRFANPKEESYVSGLYKGGINKMAQKVGEEAVELIIEAKDNDGNLFLNEAADLLFHILVLLQAKGFSLSDVKSVLEKRHTSKWYF